MGGARVVFVSGTTAAGGRRAALRGRAAPAGGMRGLNYSGCDVGELRAKKAAVNRGTPHGLPRIPPAIHAEAPPSTRGRRSAGERQGLTAETQGGAEKGSREYAGEKSR